MHLNSLQSNTVESQTVSYIFGASQAVAAAQLKLEMGMVDPNISERVTHVAELCVEAFRHESRNCPLRMSSLHSLAWACPVLSGVPQFSVLGSLLCIGGSKF